MHEDTPSPTGQSRKPSVSAIICSRNRPKLLAETIHSILQGTEVPDELIIVDQSDLPEQKFETLAAHPTCHVRHVRSRSLGLSSGRNLGVAMARHDLLIFTDDDMLACSEWCRVLVRELIAGGPAAVITGKVLAAPPEVPGGFVPSLVLTEHRAVYSGRIGTDILAGGNMAIHRTTINDVGGFDERLGAGTSFPAAEDNDLGFRLLEAGYQIRYVPEAVLYHRAWRSSRDYLPLRWRYGRGKGGYYAKYISFRDPYLLWRMLRDICYRAVRFPWRLLRNRRKALGDVMYVAGVLAGLTAWLVIRVTTGIRIKSRHSGDPGIECDPP